MQHLGRALALLLLAGFALQAAANPRFDYLLHCGGCHIEDGSGNPPEVPDLRKDLAYMIGFDAGRAYLVQVPGSAQAPLSDAGLAAVLNWMIDTYYPQLGGDFERFSPEEVTRHRSERLLDPKQARAALWPE
ncbi:MAG: hypothetical protein JJT88_13290 [Gammaproteobacteria bacterium]|nr:hypothetical protein [Gammaproteobacteria bacterium]